MKATLVQNRNDENRVLLEMESFEEGMALKDAPDLICIMHERTVGPETPIYKLSFAIRPTRKMENYFGAEPESELFVKLRKRIAELEPFEPKRCPDCDEYMDNVGTSCTDDEWWCEACEGE